VVTASSRSFDWRLPVVVAVIALLGGGAVAALVADRSVRFGTPSTAAGSLATSAKLVVAGPLAVGADGTLYVADVAAHRVLARRANGSFKVVASGLAGVSDLAVAPGGGLFAAAGDRVLALGHDGVTQTVARVPLQYRQPLSIAFSPRGTLYVSSGSRVDRISAGGRLATLPNVVRSGTFRGRLNSLGPIAVDARGDVDVAGYNGWSVWQITPAGLVHQIGGPNSVERQWPGAYSVLERGPDGAVYAEDGDVLLRIEGDRFVRVFSFGKVAGENFLLTNFAFGPHGVLYADEIPGGISFEARQQLVSVSGARVRLLWEQPTPHPRSS
jgi:hypothetical protein